MQGKSDATVDAHSFACQHPAQRKRGQGSHSHARFGGPLVFTHRDLEKTRVA